MTPKSTRRHPFHRYFRRHGHYPRLKVNNGAQRLVIEFAPGYVHVRTFPHGGEIWITRSAFITVLRRSLPIARAWQKHPDFDVPQAIQQYHQEETAHLAALRQEKRTRVEDHLARDRQRQRFLKAQARSAKRRAEEDEDQ